MGQRPFHPGKPDPAGYRRVFINVSLVIVINEVVTQRLAKNQPGDHRQNNANAKKQLKVPACPVIRSNRCHQICALS